ncbi:MAG: hypothetical protein NC907_00685 [Candidatus Omnitrophica bacterium]|nr:hypothetical protein [Candidatus Omnitrophota bacterium]
MTGRERFCKVMEFKEVDRVPNYELGLWGQTIQQWHQQGLPRDALHFNWFEGEPYFKIDKRAFAPINTGMIPGFEYRVIEEDERTITARHENGIVTKALKEGTVRGTRMSMDQYISFPVTDRKSFQQIKKMYDPSSPIRYPLWWDEMVKMWKTRTYPLCLLTNASFGLYSQLRKWVGTENISYMFYDDPVLIEEMLDFSTNFLLVLVERALNDIDFDYFNFFEDFAGKGGPLISPAIFKKFFMPYYKKITERFRKAGIKYFWLDSDGNVEVLFPLMIEAGINCVWPLEQASDMDPVRLRKKYGKDLAFSGGIDKRVLMQGKKEIEQELYSKIPFMIESGGYIPTIDHTIPPDTPFENFVYYLELKIKLLGG